MEKSNFLQKIPLESGLTTHFGYMGVHIEKPHGHFFCTSYYPKYRHLDQCARFIATKCHIKLGMRSSCVVYTFWVVTSTCHKLTLHVNVSR